MEKAVKIIKDIITAVIVIFAIGIYCLALWGYWNSAGSFRLFFKDMFPLTIVGIIFILFILLINISIKRIIDFIIDLTNKLS